MMEAGDRRRMVLAAILTVVALPFLWSAKRDQAGGSSAPIAAIAPGGDLVDGATLDAPTENISPELVEPAYLGGSATTATPAPVQYNVAAPPTGQTKVGRATYERWRVDSGEKHPCSTDLAPYGTRIVITNTDNGYKVACVNVRNRAAGADVLIRLDTDTFVQLADLAEAPIPVELSW